MTGESAVIVPLKPTPRTAEEWCARLQADDVTGAERQAFETWLEASPDNRAEYELCALVIGVSRGLRDEPALYAELSGGPTAAVTAQALGNGGRMRWMGTRIRWLAAAGVAAAAVTASFFALWMGSPATYATHVGEQKVVALADGSTVELNTASAIAVDLEKSERHVVLRQGEAFFSVAPNRDRPFVVQAGASVVRVLGTKFNVRVDGDKASVTVIEGKVEVTQSPGVAAATPVARVALLPGEGVSVAPAQPLQRLLPEQAARKTSWREGKIDFESDPLAKVIEEVNRYSDEQFVIVDPALGSLALSGVFRTGDTESVLFALRETYGMQARREGRFIYLSAARR